MTLDRLRRRDVLGISGLGGSGDGDGSCSGGGDGSGSGDGGGDGSGVGESSLALLLGSSSRYIVSMLSSSSSEESVRYPRGSGIGLCKIMTLGDLLYNDLVKNQISNIKYQVYEYLTRTLSVHEKIRYLFSIGA